jgi:hypothetical protein
MAWGRFDDRRARRLGAIVMALVAMSCATGNWGMPGGGSLNLPTHDKKCFRPLEDYCQGNSCPSYGDGLGYARRCPERRYCVTAESGTCGEYRYTATGDGFSGSRLYFNDSNAIVAATTWTDSLDRSPCPGWKHYGKPMTCESVALEKLR